MKDYFERVERPEEPRLPFEGRVDLTYRCNNACRHCWINIPANSPEKENELGFDQITRIVDEARSMGSCTEAATKMGKRTGPDFVVTKGSDLSLSGSTLVELLRAVLDKGVPVRFQARGFSMSPFIKNKDVITISPLKGKRPGLGEIIAFVHKETDGLCIHRIVRKERSFYITKGDNTSDTAEIVPAGNILGSVSRVKREGKEVFLGLGPERYLIALLGCRGLLFPLLLPVWRVVRPIFKRTAY